MKEKGGTKPENKWKGIQLNYSTAGLKAQLEKYLEVLQDQYRQYICICVVKGKIFNHLLVK